MAVGGTFRIFRTIAFVVATLCCVGPGYAETGRVSLSSSKMPPMTVVTKKKVSGKTVACSYKRARVQIGVLTQTGKVLTFEPLDAKRSKRFQAQGLCPSECKLLPDTLTVRVDASTRVRIGLPPSDTCGLALKLRDASTPAHGEVAFSAGADELLYLARESRILPDRFDVHFTNGQRNKVLTLGVTISAPELSTPTPAPTLPPTAVPTPTGTAQPAPVCVIRAIASTIAVVENQPTAISIPVADSCGNVTTATVNAPPAHGSAQISASGLTYTPRVHYLGADQLTVEISSSVVAASSKTIQITVSQSRPEFAGLSDSLEPYRENLTPNEVNHFLRKVALGGNPELYSIGVTQGRTALVNALVNYVVSPSVDAAAAAVADDPSVARSDVCAAHRRFGESLLNMWLYQMRYGDPLKQQAAIHLHDIFAINLDAVKWLFGCATGWGFEEHFRKLQHFALGSYEGFTTAMIDDPAMSYWLDNRLNRYGVDYTNELGGGLPDPDPVRTGNQNFGRELMELFTIGKINPYTGARNYSEADVESATRSLSGWISNWDSYRSPIPGFEGWYGGQGVVTLYLDDLHAPGQVTMFASVPGAQVTDSFTPQRFVHYLLRNHPFGAKNIAYNYFNRYAYVHPPEAVVNQLAQTFLASDLSIVELLKKIMNSSAMFSTRTLNECIDSPTEQFMYFVKRMNYPLTSLTTLETVRNAMFQNNHALLHAPNVFAWGICGDNTLAVENHGETWLQNQLLLNRYRAVNDIIRQEDAEGVYIKDLLFPIWNNPTAAAVVARFEEIFGFNLNEQERTLIRAYLDRPSDPWNPSNSAQVRTRLAGVAFVMGTHIKMLSK